MKWISGLKPRFENQVQTRKWKTWKWEVEFQVYFNKSLVWDTNFRWLFIQKKLFHLSLVWTPLNYPLWICRCLFWPLQYVPYIYSRMCYVWVSDILYCSCAKSHLGMYEINCGGFFLVFLPSKLLSQHQFEQHTVRAPLLSEAY